LGKQAIYVLLILLVSIALRLYPTIISGLPFSTDSWPLIRNAESFIEYSPTSLESRVFDDYNIYWPLSQIEGAILSIILPASPLDSMRIYIPFLASLSPLILYIFLKRLTGNELLGFLAGLLFAAGGPHAIFTAGVTKETFSGIFFIQMIYLFSALKPSPSSVPCFIILSSALTMSHHLSYLVLVAILANILVAEVFLPRIRRFPLKWKLVMLVCSAAIGSAYYLLYASRGLKILIGFSDWLSAFSFQALAFMTLYYVIARPKPRRLPNTWIAVILIAFIALLANQLIPLIPAAPRLSPLALFYACLMIFIGIFDVLGLYSAKEHQLDGKIYPIIFWISAVLGLEGYAVFGADPSISLSLAYRLPNFILPALAALAVIGIPRLVLNGESRFPRILSILILSFLVAGLMSQSYSAVFLKENYLGYQWLYLPQEFQEAIWLSRYVGDQVVHGDLKIKYLVGGYLGLKVDSGAGYAFLTGKSVPGSGSLLMVYREMWRNGYLLGPYGVELPCGWSERLTNRNMVFSNLYAIIYEV